MPWNPRGELINRWQPNGPPLLSISCNSPPNGTVGVAYSQTFPASNGTPPYTFLITLGTPPPGTLLNASTGVIAGTPTQAGTFTFTIQVNDSAFGIASVQCSITIVAPFQITFPNPPIAILGLSYVASLNATGGTAPYTYTVTSGSLPPGISLASNGQFSGIPTQIGTYGFTVKVVDSASHTVFIPTFILVTGGYSPGTPTILFEWAPSFLPKREITYARPTDWTDCGYKGRKFIRGFRAHANTFGTPRVVNVQFDGGQVGPYVTMLHNGEETLPYSLTPFDEAQPLIATYVRITPTSTPGVSPLILPLVSPATSDWCFWDQDTEWEYDPYPDLTTLRTPWQQPGGGGLCWIQGIRLTADTAGLYQDLRVLKDGNILATTINVNHNGQQTLPYTWAPFLAHDLAIQPLGPCAIWSANQLAWVFTPVPENVQYWIARPTSFGMKGFFHIRDGIFAYGGGPGIFTITMDTGETFSVNLPAATSAENKFYFVTNPLKGMLATLSAVGFPSIQVYVEDIELRVKEWGSTGPYQTVRMPGDISRVEARI